MTEPIIHIVDDDEAVRDALGVLLMAEGLSVRPYPSGEALIEALPMARGGCVVTDVHMRGMGGLGLLRRLRTSQADIPVIVITGRTERAIASEAAQGGAFALIEKPFGPDEFLAAVRKAIAA